MILIDAEQLSKHKYVVGCDGAVDMRYISAVNILAYKLGWNDALDSVEEFASIADAEPVRHGHWIFGQTMGHSWMKCSECCVSQSGQTATFTYCPNCGAKMDEVEE